MVNKRLRYVALALGAAWVCWWVCFEAAEAVGDRQVMQAIIFMVVMFGAVAIAWTLSNPAVTGAIVGARKREQVDDVIAAAGVRLTQSDLTQIEPVAELAGRGQ